MRRIKTLATLTAGLAATVAATALPAHAAVSSASIDQLTATLNLDDANDNVTVSVSGGLLVHGQTTGGLNSGSDWDSATLGDQTVPADGTRTVIVNGGGGNDSITVLARNTELASSGLNGDAGDDVITGPDSNDTLTGGDGNDRLVAGRGDDVMQGGAGSDTLVWNQGDGSDRADGQAGNDSSEVNGAATLGDAFTIDPVVGGTVQLRRTNLGLFTFDAATERFEVNGLGGDDSVTANNGVGAATLLTVDGGAGADTVNGSEGADLILGGEANDVLSGGGGDDRIVGDRGGDTMNGGEGDDTLVWNNGDGSDVANGDDGRDDVEVNGAPAADDTFTVQPNGARIKFDRSNLVPFSIDIGSADDGDDQVNIRDRTADLARGGDGNDSVVADVGQLDIIDGFEAVDRTPNATPPPVDTKTRPVTIRGGKVKVKRGIAPIKVSAPAGPSGNSTGTLTVRTAQAVRLAGLKVTLQLGSARYNIAPGASKTLKVKLAQGSQRLAGSNRQLKVVAVASTGPSANLATSSKRLMLKLGTTTSKK